MTTAGFAWAELLGGDPRPWIASSDEPAARWVLATQVLGEPADDVRRQVLADAATQRLVDRLPDWEAGDPLAGHNSVAFAPNLLNLLADMGVRGGDDEQVERLLDRMLAHQEDNGRFPSYAARRLTDAPVWGALLCDAHAVAEVLVRFGRERDPRVRAALRRMEDDLTGTAQGRAWPCIPHPVHGFRGPGRASDFCPQVTLQALRTFAGLPAGDQPAGLLGVASVSLAAWRRRGTEKPYMFGHGRGFKTIKWPPTWYSVYALLDTLGRYPALWRAEDARPENRRALAELLACLVTYNRGPGGAVVPRSVYRGLADFSWGQKKRPSAFATARVLAVLVRFDDLAEDAAAVDVRRLPSSKGGSGTALPPP
ncbi:hypothetical protein ACFOWZ_37045 [Lentzea rhizosphaerae]|uniref:Prenyltransferase and squalene oxidase repeat-containing protein n=1 Tax=Lentzea rhizosphaerae TaxID=2041025 RepID=A0ABV8C5V8_9PSEU